MSKTKKGIKQVNSITPVRPTRQVRPTVQVKPLKWVKTINGWVKKQRKDKTIFKIEEYYDYVAPQGCACSQ